MDCERQPSRPRLVVYCTLQTLAKTGKWKTGGADGDGILTQTAHVAARAKRVVPRAVCGHGLGVRGHIPPLH